MELNRLLPIALVLVVSAAGAVSVRLDQQRLQRSLDFLYEFNERFIAYANSFGENQEAYDWLVRQSDRMQREMGGLAILPSFKPPSIRSNSRVICCRARLW